MEVERLAMPDNSWRAEPIPGAPPGKCWRMCDKPGHTAFYLVKAFHGISVYQCLVCRKIAKVETRTGKTCLSCGKPLTGRQQNWCGSKTCGQDVYLCHDRDWWRKAVLRRDNETCQRCGWTATEEQGEAYNAADKAIRERYKGIPYHQWPSEGKIEFEAMRMSGWRRLEAHHITPLEWGGPEFDLANGMTLCHVCHDQAHRELGALRVRRGAQSTGEEKKTL